MVALKDYKAVRISENQIPEYRNRGYKILNDDYSPYVEEDREMVHDEKITIDN